MCSEHIWRNSWIRTRRSSTMLMTHKTSTPVRGATCRVQNTIRLRRFMAENMRTVQSSAWPIRAWYTQAWSSHLSSQRLPVRTSDTHLVLKDLKTRFVRDFKNGRGTVMDSSKVLQLPGCMPRKATLRHHQILRLPQTKVWPACHEQWHSNVTK